MPVLGETLILERCPHCSVDTPNMAKHAELSTKNSEGERRRFWRIYTCNRCGGVVTAWADKPNDSVMGMYPEQDSIDDAIPDKAKRYLEQALMSLHVPAGAVMLAASSVDAMLKTKGYIEGTLFKRIEKAAVDHLITEDMKKWAHEVRLDANEQRHADLDAELPTAEEANRVIEFAKALAMFLFVLPSRVSRGLAESKADS